MLSILIIYYLTIQHTIIKIIVLSEITLFWSFRTKNNLKNIKIMVDRTQTVSQRFKPISCTILIGEQPNP